MCANEVESLGKEKEKLHEIKKNSYSKWGHFARFSALYVWFFCHFVFYLSFAKIAGRVQLLHWSIRALDQTLNRYTSSALLSSVTRVQCFEGYYFKLFVKESRDEGSNVKGSKTPRGGGVLLGILGGGLLPRSPNPDPISDEKMSFLPPVFRPDLFEIMSSLLR